MDLAGKVALVTGAAHRVGRAIAEELGQAGATLVVHHLHSSSEEATQLAARFPGSIALRADLRQAAECAALVQDAKKKLGCIDLLVNSAAGYKRAPFPSEADATWDDLLALNLVAPARLVRLALPHGLSSVVNIVDVAAWQPWKNHAAYAATKAGLLQLTRDLALELAPKVRVNAVAPGTVAFPEDFSASEKKQVTDRIPLGKIGAPTDVARAVRYLLVENFLTGVVIPVDGGASLR